MNDNDLKKYSVIVEGGSGCIFQPSNILFTYILTAKHVLKEKKEGDKINIFRLIETDGTWTVDEIPFVIENGVNYFVHGKADAAILVIDRIPGYDAILIEHSVKVSLHCLLCGFPMDKRKAAGQDKTLWFKSHTIKRFTDSKDLLQGAEIEKNQNQENILGISGGGLFRINDSFLSLLGIQGEIAKSLNPEGEIDFVPMVFFDEIATTNDKLSSLLPCYINSFSFLRDEIMKLEECYDATFIAQVRNLLQSKTDKIGITPADIINLKNQLLVADENQTTVYSKTLWISWLEYLIVFSIIHERELSIDDVKELFNNNRLIHSDTGKSWMKMFKEILETDFSGIAENSVVIVSTKGKPKITTIDKGVLQNIASVTPAKIDVGQSAYLKGISKFIHIRAFEADCIENNQAELSTYTGIRLAELIENLKNKFNGILQN